MTRSVSSVSPATMTAIVMSNSLVSTVGLGSTAEGRTRRYSEEVNEVNRKKSECVDGKIYMFDDELLSSI